MRYRDGRAVVDAQVIGRIVRLLAAAWPKERIARFCGVHKNLVYQLAKGEHPSQRVAGPKRCSQCGRKFYHGCPEHDWAHDHPFQESPQHAAA